jgi:hypothetical protein
MYFASTLEIMYDSTIMYDFTEKPPRPLRQKINVGDLFASFCCRSITSPVFQFYENASASGVSRERARFPPKRRESAKPTKHKSKQHFGHLR